MWATPLGREATLGVLATMPRSCVADVRRNASDFFGALLALALGFSLVGMVLC